MSLDYAFAWEWDLWLKDEFFFHKCITVTNLLKGIILIADIVLGTVCNIFF